MFGAQLDEILSFGLPSLIMLGRFVGPARGLPAGEMLHEHAPAGIGNFNRRAEGFDFRPFFGHGVAFDKVYLIQYIYYVPQL